jgi:hypothetical protein
MFGDHHHSSYVTLRLRSTFFIKKQRRSCRSSHYIKHVKVYMYYIFDVFSSKKYI